MPARRSLEGQGGEVAPLLHDHAFEPQSTYDFEDSLSHADNNITPFNTFTENMEFEMPNGMYDEDMEHEIFEDPNGHFHMGPNMFAHNNGMPNVVPGHGWQSTNRTHGNKAIGANFGAPVGPQSAQKEIVNSRSNQVDERFGQITPPNDSASDTIPLSSSKERSAAQKSQEEDIAKLNRTQRARNAANKRHSKSKSAKKNSVQDNGSEDEEVGRDQSKSTNLQREKNRVAAAKCRAKKKANSEEMQETHREGARQNSYLLREMRELRDQKAFLRNSLLQHDPGVCQCHAIHRFNMAQAQQLAFGVGSMMCPPVSPSYESGSSVRSPDSDVSSSMTQPSAGPGGASRGIEIPSRRQSIMSPSNYTFDQITSPDPTLSTTATATDPTQMPQQFTDFLHSSPQGRAGFS